ncbi:hypothetical protein [Fibrella forsythiae]|uniref:Glycosyl hydrolase family 13 catalytic domain-containing protein n=1 Tax=Fibrella forsythiae TaxID=2817061 RepID=A0ABS3JP94_9BACT|nr:hypothetical protein [Fibrella forsythiae]MBO0951029.1 hypothetical protein [Fibrella forsythiae]
MSRRAFGVTFIDGETAAIRLWHLRARNVAILVEGRPEPIDLNKESDGYWSIETTEIKPGDLYSVLVDNERVYPDSASIVQPQGIYGPSQAVDITNYYWDDGCWVNAPFDEYRIAELAVATFTPAGTFCAAERKVGELKKEGVNAVVIQPTRPLPTPNAAGFTAASLYTIQATYGTPTQLQHFINTCHYEGIAVCVDLDYGLLHPQEPGREPVDTYFIRQVRTALTKRNQHADDARSQASLRYCVDNALMWFRDFHIDALRLNGIQSLPDADVLLTQIRQAANELTAQTGHQYYLLIDCDQTRKGIAGQSYQQFPCREEQLIMAENDDKPTPAKARRYRLDFLYERRFAGVLRTLFGRRA